MANFGTETAETQNFSECFIDWPWYSYSMTAS